MGRNSRSVLLAFISQGPMRMGCRCPASCRLGRRRPGCRGSDPAANHAAFHARISDAARDAQLKASTLTNLAGWRPASRTLAHEILKYAFQPTARQPIRQTAGRKSGPESGSKPGRRSLRMLPKMVKKRNRAPAMSGGQGCPTTSRWITRSTISGYKHARPSSVGLSAGGGGSSSMGESAAAESGADRVGQDKPGID